MVRVAALPWPLAGLDPALAPGVPVAELANELFPAEGNAEAPALGMLEAEPPKI